MAAVKYLTKLIPKCTNRNLAVFLLTTMISLRLIFQAFVNRYKPQDSLLFEGTVAENIALNDPQASTDSIIAAAKIACAHDFIMGLLSYATPQSRQQSGGGQRQRIFNTILANPQLLVMDEATSAMDYNTERQLCLNLQDWAEGRTVLFITHRLSSIRNSDHILVMHEGRLVEQGTHESLIGLGQRYAALYSQQDS